MGPGFWVVVLLPFAAAVLAAGLGLWHDRRPKPRREFLLTVDRDRARIMLDFYLRVHGAER